MSVAHIRIFKHYLHVPFLLLGMVELCVFLISVYLGGYIRFYGDFSALEEYVGVLWPRAWLFAMIMLIAMTAMGVYQARFREGLSGVMLRTAVSYFMGAAALSVIFYIFPDFFLGRGVFLIAAVVSFAVIWVLRLLFSRVVPDTLLKKRVLVLGAGRRAQNILDKLNSSRDLRGFILVGFIPTDNETPLIGEHNLIERKGGLCEAALAHEADEIVVAVDDRRNNFPLDELLDCKMSGIDVVDVINFFERETGRVEVDLLHPSWLVFSDGFSFGQIRSFFERSFDLVSSLSILLVTWPIMLFTIVAILLEDGLGASMLYRQKRVGLNGRVFYVYKFRSMREDAEKGGVQWARQNDSRVTRVGRFIRKYRIDELPQILNVLKGDMGFVGPRPERPEFVEKLSESIPFFSDRHRVKPGITGWAQLCYPYGASEEDARMKLKYDLYYVKNHSLLLDILILIQTVEVILFGKGAR